MLRSCVEELPTMAYQPKYSIGYMQSLHAAEIALSIEPSGLHTHVAAYFDPLELLELDLVHAHSLH